MSQGDYYQPTGLLGGFLASPHAARLLAASSSANGADGSQSNTRNAGWGREGRLPLASPDEPGYWVASQQPWSQQSSQNSSQGDEPRDGVSIPSSFPSPLSFSSSTNGGARATTWSAGASRETGSADVASGANLEAVPDVPLFFNNSLIGLSSQQLAAMFEPHNGVGTLSHSHYHGDASIDADLSPPELSRFPSQVSQGDMEYHRSRQNAFIASHQSNGGPAGLLEAARYVDAVENRLMRGFFFKRRDFSDTQSSLASISNPAARRNAGQAHTGSTSPGASTTAGDGATRGKAPLKALPRSSSSSSRGKKKSTKKVGKGDDLDAASSAPSMHSLTSTRAARRTKASATSSSPSSPFSSNLASKTSPPLNSGFRYAGKKPHFTTSLFDRKAKMYVNVVEDYIRAVKLPKKIVIDTKTKLKHAGQCSHQLRKTDRSKLVPSCVCDNHQRKYQIGFHRIPDCLEMHKVPVILIGRKQDEGTANAANGRCNGLSLKSYKALRSALSGIITYIQFDCGFYHFCTVGSSNTTLSRTIAKPGASEISVYKDCLAQFGVSSDTWCYEWASDVRFWPSKLLATIAGKKGETGCPIDGLIKVHASVCKFFGKKPRPLPINQCPHVDCGCTHSEGPEEWPKTKKKRYRRRKNVVVNLGGEPVNGIASESSRYLPLGTTAKQLKRAQLLVGVMGPLSASPAQGSKSSGDARGGMSPLDHLSQSSLLSISQSSLLVSQGVGNGIGSSVSSQESPIRSVTVPGLEPVQDADRGVADESITRMGMEAVSGLDVFVMLDQLRKAIRKDVKVFVASEEPERYVYDLFQKLPETIDSECSVPATQLDCWMEITAADQARVLGRLNEAEDRIDCVLKKIRSSPERMADLRAESRRAEFLQWDLESRAGAVRAEVQYDKLQEKRSEVVELLSDEDDGSHNAESADLVEEENALIELYKQLEKLGEKSMEPSYYFAGHAQHRRVKLELEQLDRWAGLNINFDDPEFDENDTEYVANRALYVKKMRSFIAELASLQDKYTAAIERVQKEINESDSSDGATSSPGGSRSCSGASRVGIVDVLESNGTLHSDGKGSRGTSSDTSTTSSSSKNHLLVPFPVSPIIGDLHINELERRRQLVTLDIIRLCTTTAGPEQSFEFQTSTEEESLRCYESELQRAIKIFGKEDRQSMRIAYLVAERLWAMCEAPDIVAGKRDPLPLLKRADSLLGDVIKWLVPRKQPRKDKKRIEELRRSIEDDLERQARVAEKRKGGTGIGTKGTKGKKRKLV